MAKCVGCTVNLDYISLTPRKIGAVTFKHWNKKLYQLERPALFCNYNVVLSSK